jgi:hypothetical protein
MKNKYTRRDLLEKFEKLSSTKKIIILLEALNYMEQYNGRSLSDCVVLAMADFIGLEHTDGNLQEFSKVKSLQTPE